MKKYFYLMMLSLTSVAFIACEDVPEPYSINTTKAQTDVLLSESFSSSLGKFQSKAASGDLEWFIDFSSAVITGYKDFNGDGKKTNQAGVTYLVGPTIDLTDVTAAYVSLSQAINYEKSTIKDDHKLLASEDYTNDVNAATWTELPLLFDGVGGSFTFVDQQVQIPESLMGKKINIALKHTAHDSYSSTWEVKNLKVQKGQANSGDGGETPTPQPTEGTGSGTLEDPYNSVAANSVASALASGAKSDVVYIKGKVVSIATDKEGKSQNYDAGFGNASFYISDDGTENGQFYVYRALYLGNKNYTSGPILQVGDEVIVCGKLTNYSGNTPETVQKEAYLYSLNGEIGGDTPTPGEAKGTGTLADPFNAVAATNAASVLEQGTTSTEEYYIKGKISEIKYTFSAQYGTATFYISDDGTTSNQFYIYSTQYLGNRKWVEGDTQIKIGDDVIIYGKLTNYNGTLETASKANYLYSLNGVTDGGTPDPTPNPDPTPGEGQTLDDFTNGDFETWADGIPTGWDSQASFKDCLSQSTEFHGGSYSCKIVHAMKSEAKQNTRLAYKELTLEAGTYTISAWVRAESSTAVARLGHYNGTSYAYGGSNDFFNGITTEWQLISKSFDLPAGSYSFIIMNSKTGEDALLVDDVKIEKN